MKRLTTLLLAILMTLAGTLVAGPAQAAPYCGIRWGSLSKAIHQPVAMPSLVGVRTGRHRCYDRLVLDLDGPALGASAQYAEGQEITTHTPGRSGVTDWVRGGAALQIQLPVVGQDTGYSTYVPTNWMELTDVSGYRTFRQVILSGGSVNGLVLGIGLRARLPFRVFTVPGPGPGSRVVIDVAHRW